MQCRVVKGALLCVVLLFCFLQTGFGAVADVTCTNPTCPIPGAICDSGKCKCEAGYKETANNTCTKVLNSTCTDNSNCSAVPNTTCSGADGSKTCTCAATYKPDANGLTCTCADGYKISADGASCIKVLNSTCTDNSNCSAVPNTTCSGADGSKTCTCAATYKPDENELTCICADGYKRSADGASCITVLNSNCTDNSNCSAVSNTTCSGADGSKTCMCAPGYKASVDQLSCIKIPVSSAGFVHLWSLALMLLPITTRYA